MTKAANQQIERDLAALRDGLLRGRPRPLRPDEGHEAFQQHKLLAAAVHRATELDRQKSESETQAWVRYLAHYFPSGRNDADDARLLFADWRSALLKRDTPGPGIAITHGQPEIHWQRDQDGRLYLNLEDAWDDFAASVDAFIAHLHSSQRRKVVLTRWRKQRWGVVQFVPAGDAVAGATAMSLPLSASVAASVSASATTVALGAHSATASPLPNIRPQKPKS